MFRRTTLAAAASLAAAALALTACSGSPDGGSSSSAAAADPDASIAVRLVLEPTNLDIRETSGAALDQILIDNVYQGLVSRTPDQEIVPALASDYTISDDGLTYTFTLREGVTFHDGQELTPDDVVWSLTQHRDTETWLDSARLSGVTSIAADGQDVVLTLSEPDSTLLWNLTGRAGIILKQDDSVDYLTAANGTGPFMVASWKQGDSVTLSRYDDYWGDAAKSAEVVFSYIPETQAALSAALAGEVDVLTGFDATLTDQVEANGDFTVDVGASTDKGVLAMNSTSGPLSDKRVRQAIRQAIDHDSIVEALGAGETLYGPIPSLDPGYEDLSDVAPYDPDAAKKLLSEAGYEDLDLTLTIPSFYATTVSQILVSDLNDVGITLTVDSVEFSTWLNDVYANQDYELSFVLHTEAHDFENWANPDYYFTYDNAEVQDLYAQSLAATDEDEAAALLAKAARIVSEDAAADWLYNGGSVVAVASDVTGVPTVNVNARFNAAEIAKSAG
ncbi:peptide/nickel transport system substrate-binding protein [Microbacterium endophyticum]|uniref:Peptide/nickel transport system substrate-binding protein n=1 Tax=Microbacterium endophyticum TaxID=1526412 RepID=A0A7W4YN70_9MICO|nr:ABC transporter substrate-binding protein [Microbacterium endophyticum]MBB2976269.1 peptide/nickel transport system substrate-binding protein [Microbacterium endophyticum]NIK35149.1 peptide/nickel transport system substrate-binding protein [Microbacterium endophyticum]